jgi:hypothetical protein
MKILVAVDQNDYSAYAMDEVTRLARNTLANVTLLGVSARTDSSDPRRANRPLTSALNNYRESFLAHFGEDDSPCRSRCQEGIQDANAVGRAGQADSGGMRGRGGGSHRARVQR